MSHTRDVMIIWIFILCFCPPGFEPNWETVLVGPFETRDECWVELEGAQSLGFVTGQCSMISDSYEATLNMVKPTIFWYRLEGVK